MSKESANFDASKKNITGKTMDCISAGRGRVVMIRMICCTVRSLLARPECYHRRTNCVPNFKLSCCVKCFASVLLYHFTSSSVIKYSEHKCCSTASGEIAEQGANFLLIHMYYMLRGIKIILNFGVCSSIVHYALCDYVNVHVFHSTSTLN